MIEERTKKINAIFNWDGWEEDIKQMFLLMYDSYKCLEPYDIVLQRLMKDYKTTSEKVAIMKEFMIFKEDRSRIC